MRTRLFSICLLACFSLVLPPLRYWYYSFFAIVEVFFCHCCFKEWIAWLEFDFNLLFGVFIAINFLNYALYCASLESRPVVFHIWYACMLQLCSMCFFCSCCYGLSLPPGNTNWVVCCRAAAQPTVSFLYSCWTTMLLLLVQMLPTVQQEPHSHNQWVIHMKTFEYIWCILILHLDKTILLPVVGPKVWSYWVVWWRLPGNYNATWFSPENYAATVADVDISFLRRCIDSISVGISEPAIKYDEAGQKSKK